MTEWSGQVVPRVQARGKFAAELARDAGKLIEEAALRASELERQFEGHRDREWGLLADARRKLGAGSVGAEGLDEGN
jgi:hypothetical protein